MGLAEEAEQLMASVGARGARQDDSLTPASVICECGREIFDGEAIRSRCVKPAEGVALCRCKRWVQVPIRLQLDSI